MFAVIYRFSLPPEQESIYQTYWTQVAHYFVDQRGAIGSCLHKGEDNLWVAYSRWPDKATRDKAWPGKEAPSDTLPLNIREAIEKMQQIKKSNQDLPQFDEICLDVVEDLL
ncbi:antibiotic biosynthesis monooxygenase [uncultured Shewanella sp.]|uniref:antibiotic biosynthesis monooxygenase family protein n=1 Tax=uncultured Shewanella sp. TaxID=173975 RepID=UPI0026144B48|nr:antibiotic biosynthesis monooxygenase [uncultured Shewanella sp.]